MQHLDPTSRVELRHLVQATQRHRGRGRIGERHPRKTSTDTGPSGTDTAAGFSSISGLRSNTSNSRSNDTSALITSTRALANDVSGAYSRVSRNASDTTAPGSSDPANANHPPNPYTIASASADTNVNAVTNTACDIAVRTPMSTTRRARAANLRRNATHT